MYQRLKTTDSRMYVRAGSRTTFTKRFKQRLLELCVFAICLWNDSQSDYVIQVQAHVVC